MTQIKDSSGFKIICKETKKTIDVTFRDGDGALTAHLLPDDAEQLGAYLLRAVRRLRK